MKTQKLKAHSLPALFNAFVSRHLPELDGSRLAVACSGGLDSLVLAELVASRFGSFRLFHINYGLRGSESEGDEAFVRQLGQRLGAEVSVERAMGPAGMARFPGSLQMKAREFRYRQFDSWSKTLGVDYVLTAHHLEDSLESFLLNLSRGTGLRGLLGIPVRRDHYRRPLLFATRGMLLEYAESRGLRWREDSSNRKDVYLRNVIRQRVVPGLVGLHPDFWKRFQRTLFLLNQARDWQRLQLEAMRRELFSEVEGGTAVDLSGLLRLEPRAYLLHELFEAYGFTDYRLIEALLEAGPGKRVESATHALHRERDRLLLTQLSQEDIAPKSAAPLTLWMEDQVEIGEPLRLKLFRVDHLGPSHSRKIYIDRDLVDFPLWVRNWEAGDHFQPFGMKGRKKVAKFLRDERIPYVEKQKTYVLGTGDRIIWVIGLRAEDRFRVTPETRHILCIEWLT